MPGVVAALPYGKLIEAYPCGARAVLPTLKAAFRQGKDGKDGSHFALLRSLCTLPGRARQGIKPV